MNAIIGFTYKLNSDCWPSHCAARFRAPSEIIVAYEKLWLGGGLLASVSRKIGTRKPVSTKSVTATDPRPIPVKALVRIVVASDAELAAPPSGAAITPNNSGTKRV